jgi:hypothetical protein
MNESKIKKLFQTAQKEVAPEAPLALSQTIVAKIRRDRREMATVSLFDLLNQLFPKVALASLLIIGACLAGDLLITEKSSSISDDVTQITEQWLFAGN